MSNEIFFTADLHLGHDSIRRHCNRPWSNVDEMDQAIIKNWNNTVPKTGTTYLLGDFAMPRKIPGVESMKKYRSYFHALNGKKILILGNHDSMSQEVYNLFTDVQQMMEPKIDGEKVFLCHYPMRSWNGSFHGRLSLYGHTHSRLPEQPSILSFDVGIDVPEWKYSPVSLDQIKAKTKIKRQQWEDYWSKNKLLAVIKNY